MSEEELFCPKCKSDLIETYQTEIKNEDDEEVLYDHHECHDCNCTFIIVPRNPR